MSVPPSRVRRLVAATVTAAAIGAAVVTQSAAPAGAVDTGSWSIDANTVTALVQQENHDEFYLASIAFRTTPGKVGSTSTTYHGNLSEVTDVDVGETHGIPNAMGRVTFNNVTRRSLGNVLAGTNPEIIGTISIAVESDLTPFRAIDRLMADVAATARTEIAQVIEPLTLADLGGDAIAARLATAVDNIRAEATPPLLGQIRLFLGSLGNADDLIDFKVNVFVAVDDTLASQVDAEIGQLIPPGTGVGGALRPRSYNQVFTGDGASYRVAFTVGN